MCCLSSLVIDLGTWESIGGELNKHEFLSEVLKQQA